MKYYEYIFQNEEFAKNFGLAMEGSAASKQNAAYNFIKGLIMTGFFLATER